MQQKVHPNWRGPGKENIKINSLLCILFWFFFYKYFPVLVGTLLICILYGVVTILVGAQAPWIWISHISLSEAAETLFFNLKSGLL
jgi:hypothetical protein